MNVKGSFKDNKITRCPSVLEVNNCKKHKRLANNQTGVSKRRLTSKFAVCHRTIGKKLKEMNITCRKREKTLKKTRNRGKNHKNCVGNLLISFTEIHAP